MLNTCSQEERITIRGVQPKRVEFKSQEAMYEHGLPLENKGNIIPRSFSHYVVRQNTRSERFFRPSIPGRSVQQRAKIIKRASGVYNLAHPRHVLLLQW